MAAQAETSPPPPRAAWQHVVAVAEEVNPFVYDYVHRRPLQYLKMAFVYLILFIPRIVVAIIALLSAYLIASCILCGVGADERLRRPIQRSPLRFMLSVCARLLLWSFGFWWISVSDKHFYGNADGTEAPVIVCNHVSFVEVLYLVYAHNVMAVGKDGAVNAPFIGKIAQALQCIAVSRTDPASRRNCSAEIQRRTRWCIDEATRAEAAEFGPWRPLLIFPEGTCGNGRAVISFKLGAFIPAVPVQPVVVRLPYRFLDMSYVGSIGGADLAFAMLGQVFNRMEIAYLPVCAPTSAEAASPAAFAQRVRTLMADRLKVPTTEHSYEDVILALEVEAIGLPVHEFNVGMGRFSSFGVDRAMTELRRFAKMDTNKNGRITKEEFGAFFNLNDRPALRDAVFSQWDLRGDDVIDFREFLIVTASQQVRISRRRSLAATGGDAPGGSNQLQLPKSPVGESGMQNPSAAEEEQQALIYAFTLCFGAFDTEHKGFISRDDFRSGMRIVGPALDDATIDELFAEIDTSKDSVVSLEEFLPWCTEHPDFTTHLLTLISHNDVSEGIVQ